jgi:signal transduction histidine kinase/HAMP domain-containing protein
MNAPARCSATCSSSIRTRLISAFMLLFAVTLAVAVVGLLGMRANQRALDDFEASVVPEIARVLGLSEKVAQVAAVASGMADTDSPELLRSDTLLLQSLLGDIRQLSSPLPGHPDREFATAGELGGIDLDLTRLMTLASQHQALQESLAQQRRQLDNAGDEIFLRRNVITRDTPTLLNLWVVLSTASVADSDAALGSAESDSEALWLQVRGRGESARQPQLAAVLDRLSNSPDSVFARRRELNTNEKDIDYLVLLMRAHADQLEVRAGRYVRELREVAAERRELVNRAVASGESGLLLLAIGGVVLALLGVVYVERVLRQMQSMTGVMTRLASGDTAQAIPATERKDEIGELARACQVFRDNLLDKQRLSQGLDAQRRLLESVFQSMTDGLSVHDADGHLVAWNPTFAQLLDFPGGFLRPGLSLANLHNGVPYATRWRAVARETATRTRDRRIRVATSAELQLSGDRILEFHCQGMPDGGWVAVCRDLTARRAVEADLRQAQKMEVLGQLTGGVAHDFNNFLMAILGNLELLQAGLANQPDNQVLAERARRAADRASQLTRRLLAFARRQPLLPESVAVDDMLAEMMDLVEYCVGDTIEVRLCPALGRPVVEADRGQLENTVFNLVLNSAAAMPDGGSLTLSAECVEQPERLPGVARGVVLRVADSGTGIPPALLGKVMEPFFTTKPPGEGSGLGLSIVYGFVRQSGGDLQIHSTLGQGSTVELWLPATRRGEPGVTPAAVAIAREPLAPRMLTTTALLVEDDPEVCETTRAMLASLGATCHAVATAEAAMQWLAAHDLPGLVLSDISLGRGEDGIALAKRIRVRWPHQLVVLTSGLPLESHLMHPDWVAGQVFIAKPFTLPALAGVFS